MGGNGKALKRNGKTGGRFNDGESRACALVAGSGKDLIGQRISKHRREPIRMKKAKQLPVWVSFHGENFDAVASVGSKDVLEGVK